MTAFKLDKIKILLVGIKDESEIKSSSMNWIFNVYVNFLKAVVWILDLINQIQILMH